jgi:hypothetical protein
MQAKVLRDKEVEYFETNQKPAQALWEQEQQKQQVFLFIMLITNDTYLLCL